MPDDFDWDNLDRDEIVTRGVRAIAVYENTRGDIVIRQEEASHQDEDQVVVLPPAYVPALISRLKDMLRKIEQPADA